MDTGVVNRLTYFLHTKYTCLCLTLRSARPCFLWGTRQKFIIHVQAWTPVCLTGGDCVWRSGNDWSLGEFYLLFEQRLQSFALCFFSVNSFLVLVALLILIILLNTCYFAFFHRVVYNYRCTFSLAVWYMFCWLPVFNDYFWVQFLFYFNDICYPLVSLFSL